MKRLTLAAGVLALATAAPALGKETTRLQLFPAHPRAGRVTTLQLRPYFYLGRTDLRPRLVDQAHQWNISAYSTKTGLTVPVHLSRNARDPYVWTARIRFTSPGWWNLYSGLYDPPVNVDVRPKGALSIWERLAQPLHTPTVPFGSPCPTTGPDIRGDLGRIGFVGTAWGVGPAYPVTSADPNAPVLSFIDPISPDSSFFGSSWFGNKVLWAFDRAYSGPLVIRGLQVDGGTSLRFGDGLVPALAMMIRGTKGGAQPSYTRVERAGCYAYQVDGATFSHTIVFEAKPSA